MCIYTNLSVRVRVLREGLRRFRFKNTVFYRCFRDFRGPPRGFSRLKSRRKPCVLSRFSRFSLPFEFRRFLVRFFEQVAKTTRFTASFGPRGRGSASVFSPFFHARFVKKCSKPRAFARYSRFLGLATDFWFCCVRFNSLLFDFCKTLQNLRVVARFFARGREPCGCSRVPQFKVSAFPAPTCGSKRLSGACGERPCLKTYREPRVFARFFAFLGYPTCIVIFLFF